MSRHSIRDARFYEVTVPLVLERDGYACVACGATEDLTVDHVKPVSLFDQDDWDNDRGHDPDHCATLCRSCNSRKGDRPELRVTWFNDRWWTTAATDDQGEPVSLIPHLQEPRLGVFTKPALQDPKPYPTPTTTYPKD